MYHDMTKGNITGNLLIFALPMIAGNLLQQFYNIADTHELLSQTFSASGFHWNPCIIREICSLSGMTCLQQSTMNFGILLVQRLVDSFGPITMAAFAAGLSESRSVKHPLLRYHLPVGLRLCTSSHAHFCKSTGKRSTCGRYPVFTHRRCLLYRNRLSVSALWILQGCQPSRHVLYPDGYLSGSSCHPRLPVFRSLR